LKKSRPTSSVEDEVLQRRRPNSIAASGCDDRARQLRQREVHGRDQLQPRRVLLMHVREETVRDRRDRRGVDAALVEQMLGGIEE
jgi:hypothetical protein